MELEEAEEAQQSHNPGKEEMSEDDEDEEEEEEEEQEDEQEEGEGNPASRPPQSSQGSEEERVSLSRSSRPPDWRLYLPIQVKDSKGKRRTIKNPDLPNTFVPPGTWWTPFYKWVVDHKSSSVTKKGMSAGTASEFQCIVIAKCYTAPMLDHSKPFQKLGTLKKRYMDAAVLHNMVCHQMETDGTFTSTRFVTPDTLGRKIKAIEGAANTHINSKWEPTGNREMSLLEKAKEQALKDDVQDSDLDKDCDKTLKHPLRLFYNYVLVWNWSLESENLNETGGQQPVSSAAFQKSKQSKCWRCKNLTDRTFDKGIVHSIHVKTFCQEHRATYGQNVQRAWSEQEESCSSSSSSRKGTKKTKMSEIQDTVGLVLDRVYGEKNSTLEQQRLHEVEKLKQQRLHEVEKLRLYAAIKEKERISQFELAKLEAEKAKEEHQRAMEILKLQLALEKEKNK